jgi:hypothetical protein
MPPADAPEKSPGSEKTGGSAFWKIAGAGAGFQAGSSAIDSSTVVAGLVNHLTGNVYAVGAATAILRLGWLAPQIIVSYFAQAARRRMPYYALGAFGRAACIALIAALLALAPVPAGPWLGSAFLGLWTLYAFVSGIVAVPYNDIVGRVIASGMRSRMLAWRFFGGGVLALGVAALAHRLLATQATLTAFAWIFALASLLMLLSSITFVSVGEPAAPGTEPSEARDNFGQFLKDGISVLSTDSRFRLFLYTHWLSGATLLALPFYIVAANSSGLAITELGILLGAQTVGSLASNPLWWRLGDAHGKVTLLRGVGWLRMVPPAMAGAILAFDLPPGFLLAAFSVLFFFTGALINGMAIGFLGYLLEISPNHRRPAYSGYFNALAAPAALLPLAGALISDLASLTAVFAAAIAAAILQQFLYARLARWEQA